MAVREHAPRPDHIAHTVGTTRKRIVNCRAITHSAIRLATFTTPAGTFIEGKLSIIRQDSADRLFIGRGSFLINVLDCPWDLDGNGTVGAFDLLSLLVAWGADPRGPPDFDGDGTPRREA